MKTAAKKSDCIIKNNPKLKVWFELEYAKIDLEIASIKLAKPALRALINAGIYTLEDLRKIDPEKLRQLHGIGKNAFEKLQDLIGK